MIIQFSNIGEEDKLQILHLEASFPESILAREIVAGFDGETALQLFFEYSPAIITAIAQILSALIKKGNDKPSPPNIVVIHNDGSQISINNVQNFYEIYQNEL